jgi:hypothetical protein
LLLSLRLLWRRLLGLGLLRGRRLLNLWLSLRLRRLLSWLRLALLLLPLLLSLLCRLLGGLFHFLEEVFCYRYTGPSVREHHCR